MYFQTFLYPLGKSKSFWDFLPLKGDDNCDEDRTTDRDVIKRVEKLGEDESVDLTRVREGPVEDSDHAVVKQTEDKKDIIKSRKNYKEVVEGVLYVIWRENVDGECVPKESKHSNRSLNIEILLNN